MYFSSTRDFIPPIHATKDTPVQKVATGHRSLTPNKVPFPRKRTYTRSPNIQRSSKTSQKSKTMPTEEPSPDNTQDFIPESSVKFMQRLVGSLSFEILYKLVTMITDYLAEIGLDKSVRTMDDLLKMELLGISSNRLQEMVSQIHDSIGILIPSELILLIKFLF
jgi:hypothetical protein